MVELDALLLQPGDGQPWGPNPLLESLGLGYLAAVLRREGARVESINGLLEDSSRDLLSRILDYRFRLLGVSLPFQYPNMSPLFSLLRELKGRRPNVLIVAGGRFSSFAWSDLLDSGVVDAVAIGEGEVTIAELHRAVSRGTGLEGVRNLVFKRNGTLVRTRRAPLANLDALPLPERPYLQRLQRDSPSVIGVCWHNVSRSRGCYGKCSYCVIAPFSRLGGGPLWRTRSAGSVISELRWLKEEYGVRRVRFADDEFLGTGRLGKEAALELANALIKARLGIEFSISVRADHITQEILQPLKRAGLQSILIGIEAGSQEDLEMYHKGTSPEQNAEAIRTATSCGLVLVPSLIPFHPWSTLESVQTTYTFLARCSHPLVNLEPLMLLNRLVPVAGSAIAERFHAAGFVERPLVEPGTELDYPFQDARVATLYKTCERFFRQHASNAEMGIRAAELALEGMREKMPPASYLLRQRLFMDIRHNIQRHVLGALTQLAKAEDCAAIAPAVECALGGQLVQDYRQLKLALRLAPWAQSGAISEQENYENRPRDEQVSDALQATGH